MGGEVDYDFIISGPGRVKRAQYIEVRAPGKIFGFEEMPQVRAEIPAATGD
jgi:hypothetical protein